MRIPTIWIVLAIAALQDYHLYSIDISHAYLNGEMDCDICIKQPEGFCEGDSRLTVCLLQKSIYGMKDDANRWTQKMHSVLKFLGFTQLYSNTSIYIHVKDNVQLSTSTVWTS